MREVIEKYTCDRCGKELKNSVLSWQIKNKYKISKLTNEWKNLDFCDDCKKSFMNWLKKGDAE